MTTPSASVRVQLDASEAISNAASLGRSILGSLTPTIDVANLASRAFSFVKDAIYGSVGAAIEAEQAQSRLAASLRLSGQEVQGSLALLGEFNDGLLQTAGVGDEAAMGVQSYLLSVGATAKQLPELTKATIGLSEVMGKDLQSAAREVGQLLHGDFSRSMKRMGLDSMTSSEAIASLVRSSALAEEKAQTFGGKLGILNETFGELTETIGSFVTQSDLAKAVIGTLAEVINALNGGFQLLKSGTDEASKLFGMFRDVAAMVPGLSMFVDSTAELEAKAALAAKEMQKLNAEMAKAAVAGMSLPFNESDERSASEKLAAMGLRPHVDRGAVKERLFGGKKEPTGGGTVGFGDTEVAQNKLALDRFTMGLELQERRLAAAEAYERRYTEITREGGLKRLMTESDEADKRAALAAKAGKDKLDVVTEALQAESAEHFKSLEVMNQAAIGGITSTAAAIGGSIAGAFAGQEGIAERFAGSMISLIGQMITQLGAAAIAAGVLGTAVPFLAGVTGGPGAIVAGTAAVVVGTGIMALGNLLGASGGKGGGGHGRPSAGAGGGGRGPSFGAGAPPPGFDAGNPFSFGSGPKSVTFVIENHGLIGEGGGRQLGRDILDVVGKAEALRLTTQGGRRW